MKTLTVNIQDSFLQEFLNYAQQHSSSITLMKDKNLAIEKGLIVPDKLEEFCISCHNEESPTFVKMDVNEAWTKIEHDVPKE